MNVWLGTGGSIAGPEDHFLQRMIALDSNSRTCLPIFDVNAVIVGRGAETLHPARKDVFLFFEFSVVNQLFALYFDEGTEAFSFGAGFKRKGSLDVRAGGLAVDDEKIMVVSTGFDGFRPGVF